MVDVSEPYAATGTSKTYGMISLVLNKIKVFFTLKNRHAKQDKARKSTCGKFTQSAHHMPSWSPGGSSVLGHHSLGGRPR